ncbi:50S ribosomal protein L23 [bacterium]|uniref:Large ribosomal subunit protein uL23 n=1 Tax=Candidatus Scatenecus faecavium TaxID=2840915 RepID=A0A9D1K4A3_9BACT|nr:50S ribosomal protein L23 [bacterium]HIS83346.1 50S ribosomal protein L23 [Candidatus Scatenecus faecavium]
MKETSNTEKLYGIIKKPLITEKSVGATTLGQYTFEVVKNATKIEIAQAVELAFPGRKVKKVRTVYMPSHEKRMGYKFGRTDSSKKAIVTIEGEPIEELIGA